MNITNFRDIGGVKNKEGKYISPNVFLRSGELSSLTLETGEELINKYNLKKIVDFRSKEEVEQRPDKSIDNTEYVHIDIMKDLSEVNTSMEEFIKIGSPEDAYDYMKRIYEKIVLDKGAQKGYNLFFNEILSLREKESILFHCFAGKDRTGIGALLILETLKVPRDKVYYDYLQTNNLRKNENNWIIDQLNREFKLDNSQLESLKVALNVDSSYLDLFYKKVDENYGSMLNYLREAIDISADMEEELQNRFIINK